MEALLRSSSGGHATVFEFVDWHMNSGTHRHLTEKDLDAFEGHSHEDAAALLAKANPCDSVHEFSVRDWNANCLTKYRAQHMLIGVRCCKGPWAP